jgi:type VI secretion system protein ImpC
MSQDAAEANEGRTGPPSVHITYEVEEDGNVKSIELPFVIHVLADLSGESQAPPLRLKDRAPVHIYRENFDMVMAAHAPHLRLAVANRLERSGAPLKVELRFRSVSDFEPEGIARQVPGLLGLLAAGHAGAADQLDEILHAPAFQRLEGTWRGLRYLVRSSDATASVKVRVFNAAKKELLSDFRESAALDRTVIFQKIYMEEYGVFGAEPSAAIIADYEFANAPDDLELLDGLAQLGAVTHAPFIAAASPRMFGCGEFAELSNRRSLSKIFEGPAYAHWRSFRQSAQAAHAVLVLPHILMRPPYGVATEPVKAFSYEETAAEDGSNLLWGNAAFALGARLAEAFRLYHWCAAIAGPEGGGLVTDLPAISFVDPKGNPAMRGPADVLLDDIQQKELFDCGFTCLVQSRETDRAAFVGVTTCLRPKLYQEAAATAAARLATQLPYVLAAARFAQYLKAILRDSSQRWWSKEECEKMLNDWIRQYVVEQDSVSAEVKAKFPLRYARIKVDKVPNYDGLVATLALRPHFQVADPGLALRLAVELPPPAR